MDVSQLILFTFHVTIGNKYFDLLIETLLMGISAVLQDSVLKDVLKRLHVFSSVKTV